MTGFAFCANLHYLQQTGQGKLLTFKSIQSWSKQKTRLNLEYPLNVYKDLLVTVDRFQLCLALTAPGLPTLHLEMLTRPGDTIMLTGLGQKINWFTGLQDQTGIYLVLTPVPNDFAD